MPKKLTHEEFLEKLWEKNEYYRKGYFKLITRYIKQSEKIRVRTKYGDCLVYSTNLLKGALPSQNTSINKKEFLRNRLAEVCDKFKTGEIKIIDVPSKTKEKALFKDKYSEHLMSPSNILMGSSLSILSSTNKEEYMINKFKEVHGGRYKYERFKYKKQTKNSTITCKIHGDFQQTPKDHYFGQGCPNCGRERSTNFIQNNPTGWSYTNWIKAAEKSKNFDSYKVYIIKCWNEEEEFYKIGRTYRTIEKRFPSTFSLPYKYKIVHIVENKDPTFICELEVKLKNINKNFKYLPMNYFPGNNECFKKIVYE